MYENPRMVRVGPQRSSVYVFVSFFRSPVWLDLTCAVVVADGGDMFHLASQTPDSAELNLCMYIYTYVCASILLNERSSVLHPLPRPPALLLSRLAILPKHLVAFCLFSPHPRHYSSCFPLYALFFIDRSVADFPLACFHSICLPLSQQCLSTTLVPRKARACKRP